ncbi:MAG: helix-turn-helix transcriptional regulator, partial [Brachybacterium tyrofermentans]
PSWLAEYEAAGGSAVALLEIQAMLRRILQAAPAPTGATADDVPRSPGVPDSSDDPGLLGTEYGSETRAFREGGPRRVLPERIDHMMAMAQFVIENYRSALSVEDVARAAHLTPSHAMTVFRDTVGATIGEYLTMCRVAEAQRLLITTSLPTTDIAERSGFGSLSSFYAHVTAACGMPPRQYRRLAR